MDYENLAQELKKNIQIIEGSFSAYNLQVLNIGCRPFGNNYGGLVVYIEVATITGTEIPNDISIKINLYDEDGGLYMSKDVFLFRETFSGYDTLTIYCLGDGSTLERVNKGRLYATRY